MIARVLSPEEVWPQGWEELLTPNDPIAFGYDPATTTKAKSNPSGLTVAQKVRNEIVARAILRFKTGDPKIARQIIVQGLAGIKRRGMRARRIAIAATSERFFAIDLRDFFAGIVPVELVIESESTIYSGEKMNMKSYLGNLGVNYLEDGRLLLPNVPWVKKDFRSVKREAGGFIYELDEEGNHADTWVSTMLAIHALVTGCGPVAAAAAPVGTFGGGGPKPQRAGIRNPFAHLFK